MFFESSNGGRLGIHEVGEGEFDLVWAHGWGQSHQTFSAVLNGFTNNCRHVLLDFPGFGGVSCPPTPWGTVEYADLVAEWLQQTPQRPRIWIGHSFGCRVGIRLASRHPELLDGLVLIAAAGIRPPVPVPTRVARRLRTSVFRTLKMLSLSESAKERLKERWGSEDYKNAGPLRGTFVKVVNEDLSNDAASIGLPVSLIYGEQDTETPVAIGRAFTSRFKNVELHILPRYGHLDILGDGRFQLQVLIKGFVNRLWS